MHNLPCFFAYASRFALIFSAHRSSASCGNTVTITTSGPVPIILELGIPGTPFPPRPPLMPTTPSSHQNVAKARRATNNMRRRPRRAYGTEKPREDWRAAYGGGRDVLRGGIAKCIIVNYRRSPVALQVSGETFALATLLLRTQTSNSGRRIRERAAGTEARYPGPGYGAVRESRGQLDQAGGKRETRSLEKKKETQRDDSTTATKTCLIVECRIRRRLTTQQARWRESGAREMAM